MNHVETPLGIRVVGFMQHQDGADVLMSEIHEIVVFIATELDETKRRFSPLEPIGAGRVTNAEISRTGGTDVPHPQLVSYFPYTAIELHVVGINAARRTLLKHMRMRISLTFARHKTHLQLVAEGN